MTGDLTIASRPVAKNGLGCSIIRLTAVSKRFSSRAGRTQAVEDFTLNIRRGRFVSLVGPSGSGKTTILNIIAGLLTPDAGEVLYDGVPLSGPNTSVGYLTQFDALLPWRSTLSNIALPLEIKNVPKKERIIAAKEIMRRVGLEGFEEHLPIQLSGGMRKRAAIARTLIYKPQTLLLDEPFGGLDIRTRRTIQLEIVELVRELNLTAVLVTHDLEEAISLSDEIVALSQRPARIVEHVQEISEADRREARPSIRKGSVYDRISSCLEYVPDLGEPR